MASYRHFLKASEAKIGQPVLFGPSHPNPMYVIGIDYSNSQTPRLQLSKFAGTKSGEVWTQVVVSDQNSYGYGSEQIHVFASAEDYINWREQSWQEECGKMGFRHGVRVLFDGPPGPVSGRFIECEDAKGRSINAGEWRDRGDGYWELIIQSLAKTELLPTKPPTEEDADA